jgi:diadenosine tetraphosphatase ApaH/serine/threonine PP2A family protein phosphatase
MAAIGKIPFDVFNGDARRTLEYHERVLTADNMDFLRSLPSHLKVRGEVSIVHGSPRDSVWEYILNTLSARLNFDHFTTPWCFVGHSHLQCMFQLNIDNDRVSLSPIRAGEHFPLKPRAIMNPGSVGQPRDRDPRAAYAIYDTDGHVWAPRRAEYNIPRCSSASARRTCPRSTPSGCGGVVAQPPPAFGDLPQVQTNFSLNLGEVSRSDGGGWVRNFPLDSSSVKQMNLMKEKNP